MIVFWVGGNGSLWSLALFLVPLILQFQPAILFGPFAALGWIVEQVGLSFSGQPRQGQPQLNLLQRLASRRHRQAANISDAHLLLALLLPGLLAFALAAAYAYCRRAGWRQLLRDVFLPRGAQQRNATGHGQTVNCDQRFNDVIATLHKLPTELYISREQMLRLSAHELKAKLRERAIDTSKLLEKTELVDTLMEAGGSGNENCSICCEDYAPEDVLRRLRCGHAFHLECIDRWFLSSTDYSRPPACPMCNAPLLDAA